MKAQVAQDTRSMEGAIPAQPLGIRARQRRVGRRSRRARSGGVHTVSGDSPVTAMRANRAAPNAPPVSPARSVRKRDAKNGWQ